MTTIVYEPFQSSGRSLVRALIDLATVGKTINCNAEALKQLQGDYSSTIIRLNYATAGLGRLLAYESECGKNQDDHFDLALAISEIAGMVAELEMGRGKLEDVLPDAPD